MDRDANVSCYEWSWEPSDGLRNGECGWTGAQTRRPGVAGPVRRLLGGYNSPARFVGMRSSYEDGLTHSASRATRYR